ncbi:MAG: hypothetical protein U0Z53_29035 [Blastocatellia bacterium]
MSEYISRYTKVAISKQRESTINTPKTLSSDFIGALMTGRGRLIPQLEKIDDGNKQGSGREFPSQQPRANYWEHNAYGLADELNMLVAPRLIHRALGGAVTPTTVLASMVYKHKSVMMVDTDGLQPPSTTLIVANGADDFLFPSMVVDSWQIQQNRAEFPQFSVNGVNTGLWKDLSVDYPSLNPPTPDPDHYCHGAATEVSWTGSNGSFAAASSNRLRSLTLGYNNQLQQNDRRPGDPFLTSGDQRTGAYVRNLRRGPQRQITAQVVLTLDSSHPEFDDMKANQIITNLTYKFTGPIISGAYAYEHTFVIPKAYILSVKPQEDGDDELSVVEFRPLEDSVTKGLITYECQTDEASMN